MNIDPNLVAIPSAVPPTEVIEAAQQFVANSEVLELANGVPLLFQYDKCSDAFYLNCHVSSKQIGEGTDTEAVLEPEDNEEYKLNRDIYEDTYAYRVMESDALKGRSFEDIVAEYDTAYRPSKPIKVFGGQHRIQAVEKALAQGVVTYHGLRLYFCLDAKQRIEIAIVNNTSIAVSNDLLDRMQEELRGSELREWCQRTGLLPSDRNFADKRSSDGLPTVRIARTLIVNYFKGQLANREELLTPIVCDSGPSLDEDYYNVTQSIHWDDPGLEGMGQEFAKLHKLQRTRVLNRKNDAYSEFANKAIHPAVASSWAFVAGLLSTSPVELQAHYELPDSVGPTGSEDPLQATVLSKARLKGIDPDTYRGLGARMSSGELSRMAELFLLQATKATRRGINASLALAAIQSTEAKKLTERAKNALTKI